MTDGNYEDFDFKGLFKKMKMSGLPDVYKDEDFRSALIDALFGIDEEAEEETKDGFIFTEQEYKHQLDIMKSEWAGESTKNRAADWLLNAWQAGYIKTNT